MLDLGKIECRYGFSVCIHALTFCIPQNILNASFLEDITAQKDTDVAIQVLNGYKTAYKMSAMLFYIY